MHLNHEHQLMLLNDILSEQHSECCGTESEYEQMERLIQSLLNNEAVNENLKPTLQNMYEYCQKGKNCFDYQMHIQSHKQDMSNWIQDLNTYSS